MWRSSAAGEDPRPANETQAAAPLPVGTEVILKSPDSPLYDQGRFVSSQDCLTFEIEQIERARILVISRDKSVRGWLHADQIVPLDQANAYFSQVVYNDSRNADAYWIRGRLCFYQSDDERAMVNLNQAIRLDPVQARYYLSRSLVFVRKKQLDRALQTCDQAIRTRARAPRGYLIARTSGSARAISRTAVPTSTWHSGSIPPTRPRRSSAFGLGKTAKSPATVRIVGHRPPSVRTASATPKPRRSWSPEETIGLPPRSSTKQSPTTTELFAPILAMRRRMPLAALGGQTLSRP